MAREAAGQFGGRGAAPLLQAVSAALAIAATTHRFRLAAAAALAAAWIVGSFYYRLQWPLADKGLLLAGLGTLLGAAPDAGAARARRPARGVAGLLRLHRDEALAADEFLIELTPKNGRWILVTDAWFFGEGEAKHWEAARFGEFRVAPDGGALLVGMADAQLRPIGR